jgi:hypothetical protein
MTGQRASDGWKMIELDIRDATVKLSGHNNQGDVQYIVNVTAHTHDAPVTFIEIGTLIPDQKDAEANKLAAIQQAKIIANIFLSLRPDQFKQT